MIDDVLTFWFTGEPQRWFRPDPAFDDEIRKRFGALHAEVAAGGHEDWRTTPRGELALIIVLDQFSRNLYRNDPRAFAQDERARAIAYDMLDHARDRQLAPLERMFVLLPLMHAEELASQRRCVDEAQKLCDEFGRDGLQAAQLDFAKKHEAIVERFGRFPHRNDTLGRESTDEEREFLTKPGSKF